MTLRVATIVEGEAEVASLPILFRRLLADWNLEKVVEFPTPIRVKRDRFIQRESEFSRWIELAVSKARQGGCVGRVLILLDADDDCPAELGPKLLERACKVRGDVLFRVVLANREFESWFVAAADSFGISLEHPLPADPELIRGAKAWVGRHLLSRSYAETVDQPSLTARLDRSGASRAPSFQKFCRDFRDLLDNVS